MKLKAILLITFIGIVSQQAFADVKVKFFVGDSSYKQIGSDEWQKISMNQVLANGDTVKTSSKAYVQLDMDGNLMKISENSEVTISEAFDDEKKVQSLDMNYGNVQLKMNKLKKANKGFKVNTVTSVCAVRGTEFDVSTGFDGTTLLQVTKGKVALAGKSKEVIVGENQQSTVPFGGDPSEVKTLTYQEWGKWLQESKKNVTGNELNMLKVCLEKIQGLEQDIKDLEEIREKNLKDKEKFDKMAKDAKAAGDDEEFKENASKAYKALRFANLALFRTYGKANRMNLVKDMTERIYLGLEEKDRKGEIEGTYKGINDIYNRYFEKYIKETIEARNRAQEARENRNNE